MARSERALWPPAGGPDGETGSSAGSCAYDDSAPLPLDDKCVHGVLGNGLTFFIQNNVKPAARAELRLVVKIGMRARACLLGVRT